MKESETLKKCTEHCSIMIVSVFYGFKRYHINKIPVPEREKIWLFLI